jgi:hypothetical protein
MQNYSRQVERSQQRIDELQARTLSYEASLAAIETCWDQVRFFLLVLGLAAFGRRVVRPVLRL